MIGCGAKGRPGLDLAQEGRRAESRGWCHPGDTGELGGKVVSAVHTALARGRCPCSHPGRKLSALHQYQKPWLDTSLLC